jgi:hypothetical protein
MSYNDECPICFDGVSHVENRVVTKCGHLFHTECLMKNVKINGFSCPSCRGKMVEECEEEDKYEDEDTVVTEEDDETILPVTEETYRDRSMRSMEIERMREQWEIEDDIFIEQHSIYLQPDREDTELQDEYVMRGFRWLFQQANDEALEEEENREAPSVKYVTEQLAMRGVTMEHLVSATLRCISAYDGSMMNHDHINDLITKHTNEIVYEYIMDPLIIDNWSEV